MCCEFINTGTCGGSPILGYSENPNCSMIHFDKIQVHSYTGCEIKSVGMAGMAGRYNKPE
jgi:hypothetical protein